jgi:hypothetical protein
MMHDKGWTHASQVSAIFARFSRGKDAVMLAFNRITKYVVFFLITKIQVGLQAWKC